MSFTLQNWTSYVTENYMKQFSEAFSKRLEGTGITRIQWIALYYIYENDNNLYQRELSKKMYIADSSVGRLIDRLERDGLVKRVKGEEDKRMIFVQLTSEGKKLFKEVLTIGESFNETLTKNISSKDLDTFHSVLNQMLINLLEE